MSSVVQERGVRAPKAFAPPAAQPSQSYWARGWRRFRRDRLAMVSAVIVLLLVLMALGADVISSTVTKHTYYEQSLLYSFEPPFSEGYILGADELGRDVLTRAVYGARVSLSVAGLTVLIALTIGTIIGALAGYYGGLVDATLMRFVDVIISLPGLFVLILISTFFSPSVVVLACVIASLSWTGISRLVRGEVLAVKARDYIDAARAVGATNSRILVKHILPNIVNVMIVWASLSIGGIILTEAALSFLSFGIQPPVPSWGNMLTNSQQYIYHSISLVLIPGFFIFITVLTVNLMGNGLRDALDPHTKQ
ncbi:MAG: ABC transporter permease [Anaerolineae bacterium]|nr:ABC transporter permease [Anaerolineae bacterium]